MTLGKAIGLADLAAPNELEYPLKVKWLSTLDGSIVTDVLEQHRQEDIDFPGYDAGTDPETALLVPDPWDELYVTYLIMMIHLENSEIERYNNQALLYADQLQRWKSYVVRHHMPRGVCAIKF